MHQRLSIFQTTIFFTLCLLLVLSFGSVFAENTSNTANNSYLVQDIKSNLQGNALSIEIIGNSLPDYNTFELPNPQRLILDIAHASLDKKINPEKIIPDNSYAKLTTKSLPDDPSITRFEITINESHTYSVDRDKNNLLILIHPKADRTPTTPEALIVPAVPTPQKTTPTDTPKDATMENLINASATAMGKGKAKTQSDTDKSTELSNNSFNFGGYKDTKKISVDFYKIDLHNVFRLFNDISGQNIIVDEAVKGTLTLKLNDVPWDFALDIILNLKDLRKEERFNTIVIYPADKTFVWPERAQDNLSVKADLEVKQEQDALIIEQSTALSEEIMQSKEIIRKARVEEKADNMEKAGMLYEQAFKLDPQNAKLANRLASLYLASLGINAKAVYFAKESLKIEPKNSKAALYAAIGLANMNQTAEATDYFAQSISDPTPMKEALISYASFSEQNGQPDAALKLIAKYTSLYGESVETMVSKARIYEKMGQKDKATEQYRALLASGYPLIPSLKQYIQSRLSGNTPPAI